MKPNKKLAAGLAAAMAIGGVASISMATSAQAAPASAVNNQSYVCTTILDVNGTFPGSPGSYEITTSIADDQVGSGNPVVVTVELTDNTPTNGPVALNNFTNNLTFSVDYSINGGAATTIDSATSATTAPATVPPSGQVTNPGPVTVTIPASEFAAGDTVEIVPSAFVMDIATTSFGGDQGIMDCVSQAAATNALSVDIFAQPSFAVTGNGNNSNAPYVGRAGDQFPISIANFEPNATVTLTGVQVFGAPANNAIGTVTTDGSGSYVGLTPPIPGGFPTGTPRRLRATDGTNTVSADNTGIIALYGTPTISIPSPMSANANYTATGTNWDAGQTVTVTLYNGATAGTSASGVASTGVGFSVGGDVSIPLTPATGDIGSTSIEATQPRLDATTLTATQAIEISALNCTANPTCSVTQTLEVEVTTNASGLKLGEVNNFTDFGSYVTSPTVTTAAAALDTTTVYDARGGNVGWSSVAFVANPFVGTNSASHTIPQTNLSIAVTCTPTTDATPVLQGTVALPLAGNTATTATTAQTAFPAPGDATPTGSVPLCSVPNVTSGNGGTWQQAMSAELDIPAFQAADVYTTVLTVVLTSN